MCANWLIQRSACAQLAVSTMTGLFIEINYLTRQSVIWRGLHFATAIGRARRRDRGDKSEFEYLLTRLPVAPRR